MFGRFYHGVSLSMIFHHRERNDGDIGPEIPKQPTLLLCCVLKGSFHTYLVGMSCGLLWKQILRMNIDLLMSLTGNTQSTVLLAEGGSQMVR